jgi:hypothetical protein
MDWGILGAALLTLIFSFLPYYTLRISGITGFPGGSGNINGWHGLTWIPPMAALAILTLLGLALFVPSVKLPVPTRLVILVLWAVSLLTILIGLVWVPISTSGFGNIFHKGHGIGYWLSAIVVIAGGVLSFLRLKAPGGSLPWENRGHPGAPLAPGGYPQAAPGAYPPPPGAPQAPGGYPPAPAGPPPAAPGGYPPPPSAPPQAPGGYPPPPAPPQAPGGYPPPPGMPPTQ